MGLLALAAGVSLVGGLAIAEDVRPLNGDTVTTSTTNHTTFARVDLPTAEAFSTRVAVVIDGMVVFDQTVAAPASSPAAQSLLGQGAAAAAGTCSVAGPFTSSSDTTGPAVHVGDVFNFTNISVTAQTTFGPQTILIGPDQTVEFFVAAGTINVNTNTHTETFMDQQFQATVTHATDLVFTGQSCAAPQAVPDAPTNVTASLGSVIVSWVPPSYGGTSATTSYVVTASPGGATYTVDGSTTTLRIEDPAPGTYTFTVRAVNASGASVESARSNPITVARVGGAATPVVATPQFAG